MRSPLVTLALASLAIAAFAGNSLLARAALGEGAIGPGAFSAIRLAAGALILLPLIGRRPVAGDWPGALALAVYVAGFSLAYRSIDAGTGALILFVAVQATILLAGLARGERLRMTGWAGLSLAMAGLLILLAPGGAALDLMAAAMMTLAGIAWGAYTLIGRAQGDATARTARSFLLAAPLMVPLLWLDFGTAAAPLIPTRGGIALAALSGAVTSGLGYVVWYKVIPRFGLASVASVQLATPVVAALGGAVLLSEPLTWRLVLGGGLVLGGIVLTLLKPRAHRR
jgi:drug/metabolite transporter (DMT)-like permease